MNTLQQWMLIRLLVGAALIFLPVAGAAVIARLTRRAPPDRRRATPTLAAQPAPYAPGLGHRVDAAGGVANDPEVDPTPTPAPRRAA